MAFSGRPMERVKTSPAYEHVCARIRRAVHLGEYMPGDRLSSERDLAQQLGVSRVTLREAIRVLEGEGYVTTSGRRGTRVVVAFRGRDAAGRLEPSTSQPRHLRELLRDRLDEIEDLFGFRRANEGYAARLAATRRNGGHLDRLRASIDALRASDNIPEFRKADSAFHLTIADASGNAYLQKAIEDGRADMFRPLDLLNIDVTISGSINDHSAILWAIEAGDADRAETLMIDHIEHSRTEIRRVIMDESA